MKKKDLLQLIFTGFLVIILMFIIVHNINKKKKSAVGASSPPRVGTLVADGKAGSGDLFFRLTEETKRLALKRDPFIEGPDESPEGLYLNGIAWDEVKPRAIINNQILEVGNVINGYTVFEITENKVLVSDGKNSIELKITLEQK